MNVEEWVREGLQRAGRERHVDVSALHASTKAAISLRRDHREVRSIWTGWRPMAVAAAVAGLIGAVALIPALHQDDSADEPSTSTRGEVDDTFTCPAQRVTRFGAGNDDDSFLPELTARLEPAGEAAGAPLWESERFGGAAVLRLGNSDGTLASIVEFKQTPKGFRTVSITKCSNDDRGAASSPELVLDEGLPSPAPDAFNADNLPEGSLLVMDRLTYDVRGLAKRHTMWAKPCDKTICLIAGTKNSHTLSRVRRSPAPVDHSGQLANPDDVVGQDLGLRLIAVYDRHDTLTAVSWDTYDGAITWVEPLDDGGRRGQLFVILVPDEKLAVVTLHPRTGEGRNYQRDDFIH